MKKIKEILLRNQPKIITGITLVLVLIALLNIYNVLEVRVTSNDECLWQPKKVTRDSVIIVFDLVKVEGVTWNAGIRDGDILLEIDNKYVANPYEAQAILNKFNYGEYADYTVLKNGEVFKTKVFVKKLIQFGDLAFCLLGLIWVIIGFIVLRAKPDGIIQKLFYGIGAAFILVKTNVLLPANLVEMIINPKIRFLVIGYIWTLSASFIPFIFLHFFWRFPKPFHFLEKKWIQRMFIFAPIILFFIVLGASVLVFLFEKISLQDFQQITRAIDNLMSLAFLISYVSLIINYRRLSTKGEKKPIFIILVAYTLAILAAIYTSRIAPAITDSVFNSPEFYMPIILIVIFPLAFAYSIFKYQLMDVSIVIKNTVIYGAATISIAAIYFLVIYVLGQTISSAIGTQYQGIIAGVVFVIFALVFQSTKDKFQDFLTAKFYPEQFAYQKMLIKFSHEIPMVVGLDNILDTMTKTFVNALKVKKFGIMIGNEKGGVLSLTRSIGLSEDDFTIHRSNIKKFVEEKNLLGQEAIVEQSQFYNVFPEYSSQLINEEIYTIVPLSIKSGINGILLFGLKYSGSQFAGKDLELLMASANQAAIAIENARLYEAEAEKIRLEKDLELARSIQQGLLPRCIPFIRGLQICGEMLPAMQVGGDYFDLIPVSDSELYVIVGDVSGKGLSASLYMTKLQTMVQIACTEGRSPKEILIEINRRMYEAIERNWFVTMTIALFNTATNKVRFCRAGHMPIITAANGTVNTYRTQGIGVGLERGIIFEKTLIEEQIDFKSGQLYAFYSDGITEAMNDKNDFFGEEKLIELLRNNSHRDVTDLVNDIWHNVKHFRGSAEPNDDMTLVLVRVV
jgi:sigma-B regulation protein RsbU (phosphoserine phosphatase)